MELPKKRTEVSQNHSTPHQGRSFLNAHENNTQTSVVAYCLVRVGKSEIQLLVSNIMCLLMGRSTWAGTVCAVLRAMLFSFTFSFLHQCCSHTISCSNHLRHGFNVFSFILFFFFNFIFIILLLFMFPFFRKIPNLKFMSNYFLISFFLFLLFIQKFSSA